MYIYISIFKLEPHRSGRVGLWFLLNGENFLMYFYSESATLNKFSFPFCFLGEALVTIIDQKFCM